VTRMGSSADCIRVLGVLTMEQWHIVWVTSHYSCARQYTPPIPGTDAPFSSHDNLQMAGSARCGRADVPLLKAQAECGALGGAGHPHCAGTPPPSPLPGMPKPRYSKPLVLFMLFGSLLALHVSGVGEVFLSGSQESILSDITGTCAVWSSGYCSPDIDRVILRCR